MENKKSLFIAFGGVIFGLLIGFFVGTNRGVSPTPNIILSGGTGSCGAAETSTALFELDGKVYDENSIPPNIKNGIFEIKNESYNRTKGMIDEFALTVSLSAKKNIKYDPEHPPHLDQLIPDVKVTDAELKDFFNKNKDRLPPNTKIDTIKAQLEQYIKSQKMGQVFMAELEKLNKDGKYKVLLAPPVAPIVNLDITGYPSKGSNDPKFVLIEASDYTCGHCKNIHPEVKELLRKHGDKLKLVQMNFSLAPSGPSGQLIKGAYCAQEQGEESFWKYHNAAFEYQIDPAKMEELTPNKVASVAGLEITKFDNCLKGQKVDELLTKTNETLHKNGISSTPSFFLNNKKVVLQGKGLTKAVEEAMGL